MRQVDALGVQTSDYCSWQHSKCVYSSLLAFGCVLTVTREAVDEGLVKACIMCQVKPQGRTDHFCGQDCREKAMQKC